ncbi:VPLPA-CTERM sorting domain-containing protein [Rhodobacterales bacterium HKCCE2091]|nr:VPLPA-CTERM sorting domain-containing protein [Rhodobacterales bacterium HKCCE2091]
MNVKVSLLAALLAFVAAGSSSAATITFNTARGLTTGANVYTNGSEQVAVSAANHAGGIVSNLDIVSTMSRQGPDGGAGACSPSGRGTFACRNDVSWDDTGFAVDGLGAPEILLLDFGALRVSLTALTFSKVDGNDDVALYSYGNGLLSGPTAATGALSLSGAGIATLTGFGPLSGSIFGIAAPGADDDWKLQSVSFDLVPSQVPLPAGGLLLAGGLAGLAAVRRIRRRA